jgi:hypothetical protein
MARADAHLLRRSLPLASRTAGVASSPSARLALDAGSAVAGRAAALGRHRRLSPTGGSSGLDKRHHLNPYIADEHARARMAESSRRSQAGDRLTGAPCSAQRPAVVGSLDRAAACPAPATAALVRERASLGVPGAASAGVVRTGRNPWLRSAVDAHWPRPPRNSGGGLSLWTTTSSEAVGRRRRRAAPNVITGQSPITRSHDHRRDRVIAYRPRATVVLRG